MQKILKNNGVLIVMTPSWYHHKFGPFLDFPHVTPFTYHSLKDIGLLNEWKVINVDYFYNCQLRGNGNL